jgi:N12 class adenine-specific DNA methylase
MLYPDASIIVKPYEDVQVPNNSVDLIIGNPPFGEIKVFDKNYTQPKLSIHNYFIVKSLDKLRENGIATLITSHYTLDSESTLAREEMFSRADLVGAIRLPEDTFKKNAGTEVVTDILFFCKRAPGTGLSPLSQRFIDTVEVALDNREEPVRINEYYRDHPQMVLGKHATRNGMYSARQYTLLPVGDLQELLDDAIHRLPRNITARERYSLTAGQRERNSLSEMAPGLIKESSYFIEGGKVWIKQTGARMPLPPALSTPAAIYQLKALVGLREALKDTLRIQLAEEGDENLARFQAILTQKYENYRANFGPLTERRTEKLFGEDPEYPLLASLESIDPETKEITRAGIFTERTMRSFQPLRELPDDPKAAMVKVLAQEGYLNLNLMSSLLKQDKDEVVLALAGAELIFRDPVSGDYSTAEEYLSGNVRIKLEEAISAAQLDPAFNRNVTALTEVQPEPISIVDIDLRLGQTWIPNTFYTRFINDALSTSSYNRYEPTISRDPEGRWYVDLPAGYNSFALEHQWAGGGIGGHKLVEFALNQQQPSVYFPPDPDGKRQMDVVNTAAARAKLQEIKDEFSKWIKSDKLSKLHPELEKKYNDTFNGVRLRVYDGSHLEFPGMNPALIPRPYQSDTAWRIMQDGRALIDHFVGAGKTNTMIMGGMECRRTGLSNKNMYAVPNNMVPQWREDFKKAYPAANVLAVTDQDLVSAKNRNRLFSRIATNDWDAVIVPHSQFNMLPISPEREALTIRKQLAELEDLLEEKSETAGSNRVEKRTLRRIEIKKQKFQEKLKELSSGRKDNTVYFDDLGIDMLFIDEAHAYKALPFATKMGNISGLSTRESKRAQSILAKIDFMYDTHNGRGVVFATGTPITNTLGEEYTMTRYIAPELFAKAGIHNFDDWVATFAEAVTRMEYATDGSTIRPKTALCMFVNVPELQQLWSQFADVVTQEAAVNGGFIKIPRPLREDVLVKVTPEQEPMLLEIVERGECLMLPRGDPRHPDPTEDNWLKLDGDARDISLDARFYDSDAKDHPDNKVNAAVRIAKSVLDRTDEQRGTVIIFADRYATSDGKFNIFKEIKQKLVAQGVPKSEIAIVHDYPKREAFEGMKQAMCAGRIRVALSTTEKFGIGVNVQTRLKAEIHMDLPQRPDQVEQREGRIVRYGNSFEEVELYRLISEPRSVTSPKAHDLQRAQLLERKQTFLTQFKTGSSLSRRLEDVAGDVRLSPQMFALAKAQATGNPLAMEKLKLELEIKQISLLERSHRLAHNHNRQELDRTEMRVAWLQSFLPKIVQTQQTFKEHEQRNGEGKLLSMKIVFNGREFSQLKEANEHLKANPLLTMTTSLQVNGINIPIDFTRSLKSQLEVFKDEMLVSYQFAGEWHDAPRGEGTTTAHSLLTSVLIRSRDLPAKIDETEQQIVAELDRCQRLQGELLKVSPYTAKVEEYERRLEQVEKELMPDVKDAEELVDANDESLQSDGEEIAEKPAAIDKLAVLVKQIERGQATVTLSGREETEQLMDAIFKEPSGRKIIEALSEKLAPSERREESIKGVFTLIVQNDEKTNVSYAARVFPGRSGELAKMLHAAGETATQTKAISPAHGHLPERPKRSNPVKENDQGL